MNTKAATYRIFGKGSANYYPKTFSCDFSTYENALASAEALNFPPGEYAIVVEGWGGEAGSFRLFKVEEVVTRVRKVVAV